MVRQRIGFVVVVSQFSEVAMDVAVFATLGFQLDGHVFDAEIHGNARVDQLQQVEGRFSPVDHDVGGEHDQPGLDGPYMEIVDVLDAGKRLNGCRDVRGADRWGRGFQ